MVPTWTGKMRKLFPVRENSGNFEQIGKIEGISPKILKKMRKFYPLPKIKTCKNKEILPKKTGKNKEILASFLFLFFSLTF